MATDVRECTLCAAPGRSLHADLEDRLFGTAGSWGLRQCPRCELVWLDPRPDPERVVQAYADYYTHVEGAEESWLQRAIKRGIPSAVFGYGDAVSDRTERLFGRVLSLLGPLRELARRNLMALPAERRGSVLDVGCGSGLFLRHMRSLGWQVSGVDFDPKAAEVARKALPGCEIRSGGVEALDFEPETFDAVTLSHVIEHLTDPLETLRACHRVLRPGGWLVVATPNSASLGRRRFGRHWLHWDPPRHIQVFNPGTLSRLAREAGFAVRSLSTPSSSSHFVWQASRLLEKTGSLPGARTDGAGFALKAGSIAFWAWEYLLVKLGRSCGEELLLIGERTMSRDGQPR